MSLAVSQKEQENRKKGFIGSAIGLTLIIALLIIPMFFYQNPPPEAEGILVNLGDGFGEGDPESLDPAAEETPVEEDEPVEEPVEEEKPVEKPKEETKPTNKTPEKKVVTTTDPEAEAIKAQKEKEAQDAQKKKEADEKAKKRAENLKKKPGGTTDKPGDPGAENGDEDSPNLGKLSTGTGNVGGGLSNRGALSKPKIQSNTNKTGTVVLKVCVDSSGKVVEADFTQSGSTTNDADLISVAKKNALQWKFETSLIDKQCGTISYVFKVE